MEFKRGQNTKEAIGIGREGALKKHPNLPDLVDLFPDLTVAEIDSLMERLKSAEEHWEINRKRYNNSTGNAEGNGSSCIKYLLICEAPPISGKYFYKSTNDYLFKQVWKCFFGNQPICSNPYNAYHCLANIGFLLVDSLPFPIKYTSYNRKKPAYKKMIDKYLPVWVDNLNKNFTFCADLKIALGFKLNALAIINASPNGINLSGIQRPINSNMIAASGAGQPTSNLLAQKFEINKGMFECSNC